jgi:hypothetical protein
MLCKNGHEIDPTWKPPKGSEHRRCRECWQEKIRRKNQRYRESDHGSAVREQRHAERVLSGRKAESNALYRESGKGRDAKRREIERRRPGGPTYARRRASTLARETYGMTLKQIESIGLDLYPDVRDALAS